MSFHIGNMIQDHLITLNGLQFHYREYSKHGVPLIFLHGLASQSHMFDLVGPRLANGFRVIAFDQRGHGESAKPSGGYDFKTISGDLGALLDTLGLKRAIIAGHSWGGNVALYFAAHSPGRVRAIVLIDGGFLDIQSNPEMTWEQTEKELAPPNLIGTPVDEFKQRLKLYAGKLWKPSFEKVVLENFEVQADNTIRPHLSFENHMKILRALWEQRPPDYYPLVQCPVLIAPAVNEHVEDHAWTERRRAQVLAAAKGIEKNRVAWFHETYHDIPLQRPQKLANVIRQFAREYKIVRP